MRLGMDLVAAIDAPHRHHAATAILEQMQAEIGRDVLAAAHAAGAVADGVEARREGADAELAGQHGGDAALPRSWPAGRR